MSIEVTIIMPCYNQAEYIADSINSVLAQTFKNWECIIIDDGSTDNSANVVATFLEKDRRIKYFRIKNGGPSNARNFGIQQATSIYILPLDSDDKISPTYVEECLKTIKSSPAIKLAYGAGEKFGLVNGIWLLKKYDYKTLLFGNCIHPCGMFRKTDWEAAGGYDVTMREGIEDWEFWINLLDENAQVIMLENITFYWRVKEVSRTTLLKAGNKIARMNRHVYNKHADLYKQYFADPIQLYLNYKDAKQVAEYALAHPFKFFLFQQWKKMRQYLHSK